MNKKKNNKKGFDNEKICKNTNRDYKEKELNYLIINYI